MQLTSTHNPLIKQIRRAAAAGRPTEDGLLVIEGPHLVSEALASEWRVEQVLTTARGRERYRGILEQFDGEVREVPARVFASMAGTETAQEVLALVRPREWSWGDLMRAPGPIIVLDGLQDPGNTGTIIRSAEAFGAAGALFLAGSVRVANGKFLRATAGSIFRIPYLEGITAGWFLSQVRSAGIALYALESRGGSRVQEADLGGKCALIVGSEGAGISPELVEEARAISIETEKVESLNAAVACSIALYEARQQRSRI